MALALTAVSTLNLAIYVYLLPAGAPKLQGVGTIFIKVQVHKFSNIYVSHLKI